MAEYEVVVSEEHRSALLSVSKFEDLPMCAPPQPAPRGPQRPVTPPPWPTSARRASCEAQRMGLASTSRRRFRPRCCRWRSKSARPASPPRRGHAHLRRGGRALTSPLRLAPARERSPPQNVIAQSINGSGKTVAFLLAAAARVDPAVAGTQVICVSHTRELARQTFDVCQRLVQFTGISVGLAVKESGLPTSVSEHIVIGTHGTIKLMLNKKVMSAREVRVLVLDEADELMNDTRKKNDPVLIKKYGTAPHHSAAGGGGGRRVLTTRGQEHCEGARWRTGHPHFRDVPRRVGVLYQEICAGCRPHQRGVGDQARPRCVGPRQCPAPSIARCLTGPRLPQTRCGSWQSCCPRTTRSPRSR